MSPDEYCAARAAASGSSFHYAFRFLPEERRKAITALYAFCREVDDAVDDCREPVVAQRKLDWWREEVDRLYANQAQHPVSRALVERVQRFDLAREYLLEILDGMEMDLSPGVYQDYGELRLYCYRVAGVVGLLSARIFGFSDRSTLRYAEELGISLQLVNILRDVLEDARRGRVYLPEEALRKFDIRPEQLTLTNTNSNLVALLEDHAGRARSSYRKALSLLPAEDRQRQLPGLIMGRIYMSLLDEIEQDGYRVLEHGIRLTPLRKIWIAWRCYASERRRARA